MRIRTIKPEFWVSDDITSLELEDRLLFIGLLSYVDDLGRGRDEDHLVIGALFSRDMCANPRDTLARVHRGLARLFEAGLIVRYAVANRRYLWVTGWGRHQKIDRPGKSRYPGPDDPSATAFPRDGAVRDNSASPREDVASPREDVASGTGEQGNRGTGEQGKSTPDGVDVSAIADDAATTGGTERREDVEAVCEAMASSVERRTGKRPGVTKSWRTSARLLIDRDGIAADDAIAAISWSENDDFWRANILSVPKLREKYATLSLQAQRSRAPRGAGERMLAAAMAAPDWYPGVDDPPGPALSLIEVGAA